MCIMQIIFLVITINFYRENADHGKMAADFSGSLFFISD